MSTDTGPTDRTLGYELRRVHTDPPRGGWASPLTHNKSETAIASRESLGIATDRLVVASGHQPIVFHMGIAAKLAALDAWARLHDAQTLWVVPDMDEVDPSVLRVPEQTPNALTTKTLNLGRGDPCSGPVMSIPPIDPREVTGFERLGSHLTAHAHEPTRARQFAHAVVGNLCETLGIETPTIVFASDLLGTQEGAALLDAALTDPSACVSAYNDAIARNEGAGVKPLSMSTGSVELPFWRVEGRTRSRVDDSDSSGTLVPRGLAMTAIVRAALCDAFIHGTGGMRYDTITEDWINTWRDQPLAPIGGVSATMTLALELPKGYEDPDQALWEAHHARHEPEMVDEPEAAARKRELVERIETLKARGDDTSALFQELQSLLEETRDEHADELEALDEHASEAQKYRDMHAIANERTWAYPLFPDAALHELAARVRDALR